jgi:hypothetical protein
MLLQRTGGGLVVHRQARDGERLGDHGSTEAQRYLDDWGT